ARDSNVNTRIDLVDAEPPRHLGLEHIGFGTALRSIEGDGVRDLDAVARRSLSAARAHGDDDTDQRWQGAGPEAAKRTSASDPTRRHDGQTSWEDRKAERGLRATSRADACCFHHARR